jgi:hypothetical protein
MLTRKWSERMQAALALCLIVGAALPAVAEDVLKRPKGCERVATAQYDTCKVTNQFKCTGTAPVAYREESVYETGKFTVETFDERWGALGIAGLGGQFVASLTSQTEHPHAALLSGKRKEVFQGSGSMFGLRTKMTGRADFSYKGETKEIAGQSFYGFSGESVLKLTTTISGAAKSYSATFDFSMLFNEKRDLWLFESGSMKFEGQPEERSRLRLLSLPGQGGFGATQPKYGCDNLSMLGNTNEVPK